MKITQTIFCQACGKENPLHKVTCAKCGEELFDERKSVEKLLATLDFEIITENPNGKEPFIAWDEGNDKFKEELIAFHEFLKGMKYYVGYSDDNFNDLLEEQQRKYVFQIDLALNDYESIFMDHFKAYGVNTEVNYEVLKYLLEGHKNNYYRSADTSYSCEYTPKEAVKYFYNGMLQTFFEAVQFTKESELRELLKSNQEFLNILTEFPLKKSHKIYRLIEK